MRGAGCDQRLVRARPGEERHVAGKHDDVKLAAEREIDEVGFDPRELGGAPARLRDHGCVDVDPDDVNAVASGLDGDATGAATGVEHRPRFQRVHERRLAVHIHPALGEHVELGLVLLTLEAGQRRARRLRCQTPRYASRPSSESQPSGPDAIPTRSGTLPQTGTFASAHEPIMSW